MPQLQATVRNTTQYYPGQMHSGHAAHTRHSERTGSRNIDAATGEQRRPKAPTRLPGRHCRCGRSWKHPSSPLPSDSQSRRARSAWRCRPSALGVGLLSPPSSTPHAAAGEACTSVAGSAERVHQASGSASRVSRNCRITAVGCPKGPYRLAFLADPLCA